MWVGGGFESDHRLLLMRTRLILCSGESRDLYECAVQGHQELRANSITCFISYFQYPGMSEMGCRCALKGPTIVIKYATQQALAWSYPGNSHLRLCPRLHSISWNKDLSLGTCVHTLGSATLENDLSPFL